MAATCGIGDRGDQVWFHVAPPAPLAAVAVLLPLVVHVEQREVVAIGDRKLLPGGENVNLHYNYLGDVMNFYKMPGNVRQAKRDETRDT